jgi:hypothetical protein
MEAGSADSEATVKACQVSIKGSHGLASALVKPALGASDQSIGERSGSRPWPIPGRFFSAGSTT